ncbi:MAG: hypothetical protein ABI427_07190 [Solirubrobacteraceae bacterium]
MGFTAINILLAVFVLVAIPGPLIWAIRTERRDHDTVIPPVAATAPEQALVVEEPMMPGVALA